MSNRILKAVWALAVCLPTLALAQYRPADDTHREGSFELSAGVGGVWLDRALGNYLASGAPEYRFSKTYPRLISPALAIRVGYNWTRHLGVTVALTDAGGSGLRFLTPSAAFMYTFDLNARTSPFLFAGTELTRIDGINGRTTHSTWGALGGAGVRHMLTEKLALRLDVGMRLEGYQELSAGNAWSSQATIGISYFLGGRRPIQQAAAPAPCPRCTLARVDTVTRFRRDTLMVARVDTVRVLRVDTVSLQDVDDQLVLRVQFMTDSTVLLRRSLPILDTIALAMGETPGAHWAVEGHTDNVGQHEHNMALSRGRAQAVVDYLVSKGVARSSLEARGFGETRPVFSNATLAGKAQNRRVQLRRIPPPPTGPVVR